MTEEKRFDRSDNRQGQGDMGISRGHSKGREKIVPSRSCMV